MPLWYILREQYVVLTRYWTTWHWLWKICLSNNKSIIQHVRVCTLHACLKTSDLGIFVLSVRILVDGYLLLAVFRMFFGDISLSVRPYSQSWTIYVIYKFDLYLHFWRIGDINVERRTGGGERGVGTEGGGIEFWFCLGYVCQCFFCQTLLCYIELAHCRIEIVCR